MIPTIRVDAEFAALTADLLKLQREQLPFATARALTMTAQDIQSAERDQMARNFTIRRPWTIQGIRIKSARKADWPFQYAIVFSRDPFMGLQETGGTKTSIQRRVFDYGQYLAVPLDARRTPGDVVRKQDWPQNLINPFILTARDGRKYLAVTDVTVGKRTRAVGTKGRLGTYSGTKLMYRLVEKWSLKPRLGLVALGSKLAPVRFPINFEIAMREAVAGAR